MTRLILWWVSALAFLSGSFLGLGAKVTAWILFGCGLAGLLSLAMTTRRSR